MAFVGVLVLLVVGGSLLTSTGKSAAAVRWAWLAIGLAFLAAFLVMLVRRPRGGSTRAPRWMRLIGRPIHDAGAMTEG